MNDIPIDDGPLVNPMVPSSCGALLAEEWTIDPNSTLPSFLEMKMIEEVRRSGLQALKSLLSQFEYWLSRNEQGTSNLSQIRWKICRFVSEKILKPYSPEIRFVIVYLMERASLQSKSSATLAEALHGGRRVKLGPEEKGTGTEKFRRLAPISRNDGLRFALLLALGPYVLERAGLVYRNLREPLRRDTSPLILRFKKAIKVIYPFLHMSLQGTHLLYQWKYLLGQSSFFDPYSKWLDLVLRRVTTQDQIMSSVANNEDGRNLTLPKKPPFSTTLFKRILESDGLKKTTLAIVSSAIALSWLARLQSTRQEMQQRQVIQYQPQSGRATCSKESTIALPPPPLPPKEPAQSKYPATFCPLCHQPRVNPTASTGGYVFCLKCLLSYIKKKAICPITGKDCPESSIVRLYEPRHT